MKSKSINHKRLERIVRNALSSIVYEFVRESEKMLHPERREPFESQLPPYRCPLDGLRYEEGDTNKQVQKVYVTINDGLLELVGYEGNLEGFLTDYFGTDFKPDEEAENPLEFRYIDGLLINPTKIEKG